MSGSNGMRSLQALCALAVAALAVAAFSRQAAGKLELRHLYAMDTFVEVRFYGPHGPEAADALERRLGKMEDSLSLYRPGSAVARLNEKAGDGEPVQFDEEGYRLLERTAALSMRSGGCFDPTIAPLSLLWDVTAPNPKAPGAQAILEARALVDVNSLELDSGAHSARLEKAGQAVDLGGIVKGAAADAALEVMEVYGVENGYVSLGGNLAVRGRDPKGRDFVFGIRDPRGGSGEYFATVSLECGQTMATTGDYERYFIEDGVRYHHVLDPRTGYPAGGGLISVTVISQDGLLADFLSTELFVAGKEEALAHMGEAVYSLVVVDEEKRVYASAALRDSLSPNPDKPEYSFTYLGAPGEVNGG